jgi:hypothetical protein
VSFLLAATSCDDLYAWPLLAITIALAGATSLLSVLWLALSAIALILLLTFVVRPLFIFMAKKTKHYETPPQIVQLIILITLFLISWCGEIIGLTALVAAFAVGMLVPRSPGNIAAYLTTRIEDIVTMVFLPIFFTISGLRTQIGLLDTIELWGLALLAIVLSMFGKTFGITISCRFIAKFKWRESLMCGILMSTKGLVALVTLNIGLQAGLITPLFFALMIVMVLVCTVLPCPLVELVFFINNRCSKKKRRKLKEKKEVSTTPSASLVQKPLQIMVAVGARLTAPLLISIASAFYSPQGQTKLYLLRLIESSDRPSEYIGNLAKKLRKRDEVIKASLFQAKLCGSEFDVLAFMSSSVSDDIVKTARKKEVDLLIIGCHHSYGCRLSADSTHDRQILHSCFKQKFERRCEFACRRRSYMRCCCRGGETSRNNSET